MPTPDGGQGTGDRGQGPRRASALHYGGSGAPKVTAAGRGYIADRIIEVARENGIPVREDPALAEALAALELDTEIPEDLYTAVAEAIAWSYSLDLKAGSGP
jgi:flagellar biosynthesis protein